MVVRATRVRLAYLAVLPFVLCAATFTGLGVQAAGAATAPSTTTTTSTSTTTTSTSTTSTTSTSTTSTTAPTTTTTAPGNITISPSTVLQGDTFTVTSGGWMPGTNVDATLNSTPLFLGTMLADAQGVVTGTFSVPATFATGSHTVTLTGTSIAGSVGQSITGGLTIGALVQQPTTSVRTTIATLPATGSDSLTLTAMAFLLLGTGGALVAVTRRRIKQR